MLFLCLLSVPYINLDAISFVSFTFSIDSSGLLVHCISGWDRTPLFVSLLRLSLWAVSTFQCQAGDKDNFVLKKKKKALIEMESRQLPEPAHYCNAFLSTPGSLKPEAPPDRLIVHSIKFNPWQIEKRKKSTLLQHCNYNISLGTYSHHV